jgi:hypothetical protein
MYRYFGFDPVTMSTARITRISTQRVTNYIAIGSGIATLGAVAAIAVPEAVASVSAWTAAEAGIATGTVEITAGEVTIIIYIGKTFIELLGRVASQKANNVGGRPIPPTNTTNEDGEINEHQIA